MLDEPLSQGAEDAESESNRLARDDGIGIDDDDLDGDVIFTLLDTNCSRSTIQSRQVECIFYWRFPTLLHRFHACTASDES